MFAISEDVLPILTSESLSSKFFISAIYAASFSKYFADAASSVLKIQVCTSGFELPFFYLRLLAKFLSSSSNSVDFDSAISPLSSAFSRSISTRFSFDGFLNYLPLGDPYES